MSVKVVTLPQFQAAFEAGKKAKHLGQFRVTPYYDCAPMDHFWFAGYDGKGFQEAMESL